MNLNEFGRFFVILVVYAFAPQLRAENTIIPDVVYGHKYGMALTFDVLKPANVSNRVGVLFMVSNGWQSRWIPPKTHSKRFQALLDKGFTVFAVRHGSSPKFTVPEIVDDVRRSVRFIRMHASDYGVDADSLGVYGLSAGGHLALMLGTTADEGSPNARDVAQHASSRIAAVVAFFPPTDLRGKVPHEFLRALDFDPAQSADFSPIVHVSKDDAPTLLIHGDRDKLVPLSNSTNILARFEGERVTCKLIVIEGADHGFVDEQDSNRAEAEMIAWFETHLVARRSSGAPSKNNR